MAIEPREVFDPRITMARTGGNGGRFNSAGIFELMPANTPRFDYDLKSITSRNLLLRSEFQNGVASVGTRTNVAVADMTTFPGFDTGIEFNGPGTDAWAYHNPTLQPGTPYCFSCFVRMEDGLAPVIPYPGNSSHAQNDFGIVMDNTYATSTPLIENYGYGVYRVSNTLTSRAVISGNTFVGVAKLAGNTNRKFKTTGWQLNKGSVPGDYLPTLDLVVGNAMAKGVLVEEAKTNYLLQSNDLTGAPWSGSGGAGFTKTLDLSGPGNLPATTFLASGSDVFWRQTFSCPVTTITFSCYVKKVGSDNATKYFALQNATTNAGGFVPGIWNPATGAISGAGWTSEDMGDGWYLLTYTQSSGIAVNDSINVYVGTGGFGGTVAHNYKIAAPQIEGGAMRTSYIPTTTAAVVRSADLLSVPATTLKYNQMQGTLVFEGIHATYGTQIARIGVNLGTQVANRHLIYADSRLMGYAQWNGSGASKQQGTTTPGARMRGAMTWDSTGFWISINGVDAEFMAASPVVSPEDKLWIGGLGGGAPWNAAICEAQYYPRTLTPAQIKQLSTL